MDVTKTVFCTRVALNTFISTAEIDIFNVGVNDFWSRPLVVSRGTATFGSSVIVSLVSRILCQGARADIVGENV